MAKNKNKDQTHPIDKLKSQIKMLKISARDVSRFNRQLKEREGILETRVERLNKELHQKSKEIYDFSQKYHRETRKLKVEKDSLEFERKNILNALCTLASK